jgi:hypothetical protein
VAEYVERLSELVDQLTAYESKTDPLYYSMRFIDGLRHDIKSAVLVQHPQNLDAACVLALLQEEVADYDKKRGLSRHEFSANPRHVGRSPMPLPPPPPPKLEPSPRSPAMETVHGSPVEDKWSALRAFQHARGLCVKCAEKWSRGHKCPDNAQFHAIQEMWDVFQLHDEEEDIRSQASQPAGQDQLFMALSETTSVGVEGPKSMTFHGILQGKEVLILVDSGSSHTFVSQKFVASCVGHSKLSPPVGVKVADGGSISCCSYLANAEWFVQGCNFHSDMRIIPLGYYDVVVGMDWLEAFSPMKVHWKQKWMLIPYLGDTSLLQGVVPELPEGSVVEISTLLVTDKEAVQLVVPPEMVALLDEFGEVFDKPSGMPPHRSCDHSIPLVPGATPVSVRPYRYPPAIKDEIERQIVQMLQEGIIQHSISPFSSSVLLVKKKDKTWRFCVDFRHLNAITLKTKYPVPLIDDFLDELGQASWFTSLDLTAGYHQIRLKPGEAYKTAFQTQTGHYEFRVMAFGLTGAPATFQMAMNTTLAPLLRKCVLVFFDDILIYSKSYEEHVMHVKQVLELQARDQWKVKLSKCSFAQRKITYLGHVISQQGVSTDPSKIEAVVNWPVPTNAKELRGFLGLAGYYRKFVKHFGIISKPLTELLKKGAIFTWMQDHQVAFQTLKSALSSSPVLALPNFHLPFCIETDASGIGIGACWGVPEKFGILPKHK